MRTFCLNGPVKKKWAVTSDVKVAAATLRERVVVCAGMRIVKAGRTGRRRLGSSTRDAIVKSCTVNQRGNAVLLRRDGEDASFNHPGLVSRKL